MSSLDENFDATTIYFYRQFFRLWKHFLKAHTTFIYSSLEKKNGIRYLLAISSDDFLSRLKATSDITHKIFNIVHGNANNNYECYAFLGLC